MKRFYFTFLLFMIHFITPGIDSGSYLVKLEVTCEEDTIQGYMNFTSPEKVDSLLLQQLQNDDSLFTSFVLNNDQGDTLFVYENIYIIDSLDVTVFFKDQLKTIDEDKVRNLHLQSIKENNNQVSVYQYVSNDMDWLKEPYISQEIYYYRNCTYTIFHFQIMEKHDFHTEGNKYLNNVDLTYDETFEWEKLMRKYLLWLENKKVIVKSSCTY